jgi:hypothetical protein
VSGRHGQPNTHVEIGGLADLDLPALRQHWRDFYGSERRSG